VNVVPERRIPLEKTRVPEDSGEDVVEVVGHSAGQGSDRFHLLRLAKLLFALAERVLRRLALREIPE